MASPEETLELADQVIDTFRSFDIDGDGRITLAELKELLVELNPRIWTAEHCERFLQTVDTNGNCTIEYTEFINGLFNRKIAMAEKAILASEEIVQVRVNLVDKQQRMEDEARLKAEEEARQKADAEARLQKEAEEEAKKKAEEARLKAEEEGKQKAKEEVKLNTEEEKRKAEEEKRKADQVRVTLMSGETIEIGGLPVQATIRDLLLRLHSERPFPLMNRSYELLTDHTKPELDEIANGRDYSAVTKIGFSDCSILDAVHPLSSSSREMLNEAQGILDCLDKKDIQEIQSLSRPPGGLYDLIGMVVLLIKGECKDWGACRQAMRAKDFIGDLRRFDPRTVEQATYEEVVRIMAKMGDSFSTQTAHLGSNFGAALCTWILAVKEILEDNGFVVAVPLPASK